MSKLKDLHLVLPETSARELDRLARSRGLKRTHLLRQAVERYLVEAEREERNAAMRAYADRMASHSGEFVRETSAEVRRRLLKETEW